MPAMKQEKDKELKQVRGIQIRFPAALYKEIKKRSKEDRRSFNAEVITFLERIFEPEGDV
jgi:hypothetical protein